ncbi:MAG: DNA repair protein RecN, partial [Ilumatobacteraceae bacterium]|nr:DNA repair protein RecN [Ilumatobacteraceae bacterium]
RFQAAELRAAAIASSQEDADLDAELDELAGAVEYRELGRVAVDALSDEGGAGDSIAAAVRALAGRAPFAELESRLRGLGAEVQDVAADLRRRAEDIEEDPERLDAVRGRLQLLRDLRRKYGDSLAEVIGFHDEVEHRLAELEGYEGRVADLERERQAAAAGERTAAASVGRARRAGAGALADEVQHHLRELAMPHATVAVTVGEHDPGDEVSFLLAANPGSPLLPLARVASGGELARTMLALRLVLTEAPDTLVFDEVDAGIGGSAAVAVGRNLAALGARHQVLVVTHLAQVAALAHTHVVVSKRVLAGATLTTAARIDGQDRVDEVARMLSGDEAADSARRHAADLLGDRAKRASG